MQFPDDYVVVSVDYKGEITAHHTYKVGQEQQAEADAKAILESERLTVVETYVMMKVTSYIRNQCEK